ncbi:MAG: hypothetical protein JXA20_04240 [Spirochaetes bacterium]|nr:hypothetical protein [Spirochaetota bacterium]
MRICCILITSALLCSLSPLRGAESGRATLDWIGQKITSSSRSSMEFSDEGMPVDPDSGEVISLNRGRLLSYRSSRERAMEEIVTAMKRVRVDGEHRIGDMLEGDEELQRKLYRLVSDAVTYRQHPADYRTSACRAELKIPSLIAAMPFQYPGEDFPGRTDMPLGTHYSSLIIDTRRLNVQPMLFPSIYNESGLEIYGRNYVDIRHAVRYGMVTYSYTVSEAMKHPRAGEHPYYTIALKSLNGSPVIAEKDVMKIYGSSGTLSELKRCRIIFIIRKERHRRKGR